jgi:hypothetical protein
MELSPPAAETRPPKESSLYRPVERKDFIGLEARLFRHLSEGDSSRAMDLIRSLAPDIRLFAETRHYEFTVRDILRFIRRRRRDESVTGSR